MDWARDCAAVIPCADEAASIGRVVAGVRQYVSRVYVVDDGSTDGTGRVAREAGAIVLRHDQRRGKGAALSTGLRQAAQDGFTWAATLDGDGQHLPEELPGFFRTAEAGRAALVVGNRMIDAAAMPWLRRLTNHWISRRLSSLAGRELPDSQCGFRLLRLVPWLRLQLTAEHFEVESETLIGFIRAGERVLFTPVRVVPSSRASHIRVLPDSYRWLKWWFRARLRGSPATGGAPFRKWVFTGLKFVAIGVLLGWFYGWAAPTAYPEGRVLGFGRGALHGALMPMALPSLVLGKDVPIYATNNNGRPYKLGYIVGINVCGLVFFGSALWQPRRKPEQCREGSDVNVASHPPAPIDVNDVQRPAGPVARGRQ